MEVTLASTGWVCLAGGQALRCVSQQHPSGCGHVGPEGPESDGWVHVPSEWHMSLIEIRNNGT